MSARRRKGNNARPDEIKAMPIYLVKADEATGIVDAIVSVFGVVDFGNDRIWAGAYVKTIVERSGKIRVLDQHNTTSIDHVLGRPVELKEVGRDQLPPKVLQDFPTATGGLLTRTQYNMKVQKARETFYKIQDGDINEYSIGYDALDTDFTEEEIDNRKTRVRNLRTIRLWEYSPVIWGMNPATATVNAKAQADAPNYGESEPDGKSCAGCRFFEGNRKCSKYSFEGRADFVCDSWEEVPKSDPAVPAAPKSNSSAPNLRQSDAASSPMCAGCKFFEGNRVCSLHGFESRPTDVCDDFATAKADSGPDDGKEIVNDTPVARLGDSMHASLVQTFNSCASSMYSNGYLSTDEWKSMTEMAMLRLNEIRTLMPDDIALRPMNMWYSIGMMALEKVPQAKAGRVLSTANSQRIQAAVDALIAVLESSGVYDEAPEEAAEADKSGNQPNEPAGSAKPPTDGAQRLALRVRALNLSLNNGGGNNASTDS